MNRTAASLAILALGLSACMTQPPTQSQARIATQEVPYRPGQGTVIAATRAPAPISAAAGGTVYSASGPVVAAGSAGGWNRLTVRMQDGAVQYVDTDNPQIAVGSRVELGADHTIRPL